MADQSEVEAVLVTTIAAALFPGVSYVPGTATASVPTGITATIYRGWPVAARLASDLALGRSQISVFPHGSARNTTRFGYEPIHSAYTTPSILGTVADSTVTLTGTIVVGNVIGIQTTTPYAGYAYALLVGDTLATAAAALAALVPGGSSVGAVITVPSAAGIEARSMALQRIITRVRQMEQSFAVTCWCPTPAIRDTIGAAVDQAFAGMVDRAGYPTQRVTVKPSEWARVRFVNGVTSDASGRDAVWRRDLFYLTEYDTAIVQNLPFMLFGTAALASVSGLPGDMVWEPGSVIFDENGASVSDENDSDLLG